MAYAGGQRKEAVRLLPWSPEWAETGELIKKEMLSVFSSLAIEIHHIGSTAVPGLKARPIIDIAVAVRDFKDVPQFYDKLSELGYHHKAESDSENQIFLYSQKNRLNVYVHIVIHGKTLWNSYVAFCECLKKDSEVCKKYEELKESLASRHAFARRPPCSAYQVRHKGALVRCRRMENEGRPPSLYYHTEPLRTQRLSQGTYGVR